MENELQTNLDEILLDKETNLLPENLKEGVTVLGVEGSLKVTGSDGNIKLFETVEDMNSDPNPKENDLAVVYREEIQPFKEDTETQFITFPEQVILDEPFTSDVYGMLRAVDESVMFDGQVMLDESMFDFNGYSETGMIRVGYQSEDGITYTRQEFMGDSGDLTNPVDLGTTIHCEMSEEWNDMLGYFMQVGGNVFDGLYEYTKDKQISYITSNKGTKIYIPEFHEIYEDGGSDNLHDGLTSENSLLKVETVDEHNRVLTGKFLYNLNNNAYINEQKDLIAFKSSYGRYYATDISVNWEESKVYYTNYESISLPDDTVALGINLENDTILNRFDIYTSVDKTDVYQEGQEFDYDLNYQMAQNQYTLISSNQLLPNISAYGKNGNVTGDESIYDNLDYKKLNEKYFMYPELSSSANGTFGWNNFNTFTNTNAYWGKRGIFKYIKKGSNPDYDVDYVRVHNVRNKCYLYSSDKSVYFSGIDIRSSEDDSVITSFDNMSAFIIPDYFGTIVYFTKYMNSDKNVYKIDLDDYNNIQTVGTFTPSDEYNYNVEYHIVKPYVAYGVAGNRFIVCQITSSSSNSSGSGNMRKSIYVFDSYTETIKKVDTDTRSYDAPGQSYDRISCLEKNNDLYIEYGAYYGNTFVKFIKYHSGDGSATVIKLRDGVDNLLISAVFNIIEGDYIYSFSNKTNAPFTCNKINVVSYAVEEIDVLVNGIEQTNSIAIRIFPFNGKCTVGTSDTGYYLVDSIDIANNINILHRDILIPYSEALLFPSPSPYSTIQVSTSTLRDIDISENKITMQLIGNCFVTLTQEFYKYSDATDYDYIITKMSSNGSYCPFIVGANPDLINQYEDNYNTALATSEQILGEEETVNE